jgi:DNA-directed RNA polymerase subunit H (RpoH/RPB5)
MLSLEYLSKIGRVKRVSCMMMQDRGAQPDRDLLDMSDLQVASKFLTTAIKDKKSLASALSAKYTIDTKSFFVMFVDLNYDEAKKREKMVSCDQVKASIHEWKSVGTDYLILIVSAKLSPDAKKEAALPRVSIMTHDFLTFPVARHCMVPKHTKLSEEHKAEFLHARKLESKQLPILRLSDPVAVYYGYEVDDVIRIQRPGWEVYRVVL